jgi:hypothetical protein
MVLDSATIVLITILGAAGSPSVPAPSGALTAPLYAAKPLWAPKKSPKAAPADESEEELLKPKAPRPTPASHTAKRPRIKMDESAEEEEEEEGEEEEEEDRPVVTKKVKKRYVEEEEEDEPDPLLSLFPVLPRKVSFGMGAVALRRSFAYNAVSQGETEFPRFGYQFNLESFPLLSMGSAVRFLGLGVWYSKQMGNAGVTQTDNSTVSYPISHGGWGFDARYAIPIGERVVLVPALGYGKSTVKLESTRAPDVATPTLCSLTTTRPCFGDVDASHLSVDMHIRVALSSIFGISLSGGYWQGLSVARGNGTIAAEAEASLKGFHVELGGNMLINNYFALQASIPYQSYGYSFTAAPGGTAPLYSSAKDNYYGIIAGFAVMTPP